MSARMAVDFIAAHGWKRVGVQEWAELRAAFPRITVASLLKAGVEVEQPVRGVAQHTFQELAASLMELAAVYATRHELRRMVRDQVIAAKDRARWASRNARTDEATQRRKAEMCEWMLVWLEDPAMFEAWARLRQDAMRRDAMEAGLLSSGHAEKDDLHGRTDVESKDVRDSCGGEKTPES
jgi:ribosomal protein L19E